MPITSIEAAAFLSRIKGLMEANQARLDQLDAVAGDGDHGATMVMGWRNVASVVGGDERSVGQLLKDAGAAFGDVGGAIGPLWGTALLRAGREIGDAAKVDLPSAIRAVSAATSGIAERGRSREGDKTLLDVMAPAARAFERVGTDTGSAQDAVSAGYAEAAAGLRATARLAAVRGRAHRLSHRSLGHQDPGAASAYLIWRAAAEAVRGEQLADEVLVN